MSSSPFSYMEGTTIVFTGLNTMEPFPDNLACVGNQDECRWVFFFYVITELDGLLSVERRKNNIFFRTGKRALRVAYGSSPVQFVDDKVTDRIGPAAHNIKVFGQVQTFDKVVDQE